jgi:hypothetical protein
MLFLPALLFAQKISLEDYKIKYPGESQVLTGYKTDILVIQKGDSLQMDISKYEEAVCLNENAIMHAGHSLTYSGFFQLKNLTAFTLVPYKKKYKRVDVEAFDTSDYQDPGIFYDDVKDISFNFPKIQPGAITKLNYTYHLTEPRLLNPFYFSHYMLVESSDVSVTFPKNVTIGYKLFNCDSLNIAFSSEQKGVNTIYKWQVKNIPKLTDEPNAPELPYYAAHIFIFVKDYEVNGKKINILSSTDDLFAWYQTFVNNVNKDAAPSLKLLVDSLVAGTTDETEKVKRLFYWVQDHIKYIAFEAGREGFVPRDAELVYTRRYGDCKDMASITYKMLNLAGVNSKMAWIGTRHIPYSYNSLPLPAVDNHMIAAYKSKGGWNFLDATSGNHPFGYPTYMIQGKEALIQTSANGYEIAKVPEIAPETNLSTDSLFIHIEGKKIVGHGVSHFKGYSRFQMYHLIEQKDKSSQAAFLKNFFQKGNNKFLIDDYSIVNLNDRDKDLIINYTFNVADYAQVIGSEIFINLNMEKPGQVDLIKVDRKIPIENIFKRTVINHVEFEVPKGFKITYLPENSEYTNLQFSYKIEYKAELGKVILTHSLTSNYLLLQSPAFPAWNKMTSALKEAYTESVNLSKITDNK